MLDYRLLPLTTGCKYANAQSFESIWGLDVPDVTRSRNCHAQSAQNRFTKNYNIHTPCIKFITLHFWAGSYCYVLDQAKKPRFPNRVTAISDIITLVEDLGNQIPDKSWMLYLLELFNIQNVAVELNLICQFDSQNYFEAIFQGVNKYRFGHVLPTVSHSYFRQIIMNSQRQTITYLLEDQNSKQTERFELSLNREFGFEALSHFTGIEWWNKMGNFPYLIRYLVEISQLVYGIADEPSDGEAITYRPYNALIPNNEDSGKQYPISFDNARIKKEDGCICYNIGSGNCNTGLTYNY